MSADASQAGLRPGGEQTLPCRRKSWRGSDGDLQRILMGLAAGDSALFHHFSALRLSQLHRSVRGPRLAASGAAQPAISSPPALPHQHRAVFCTFSFTAGSAARPGSAPHQSSTGAGPGQGDMAGVRGEAGQHPKPAPQGTAWSSAGFVLFSWQDA